MASKESKSVLIYIFVKSNCEIEKCNEINYINDIILVSKTILYILYLSK